MFQGVGSRGTSIMQNSRFRSFSRDSVSYPSESSSSLSGYHTGNRSRANTNDSSSLSSSENHKSKDSSNNTGTTTSSGAHDTSIDSAEGRAVRRRSHRPRGCRGGRKNRKNKGLVKDGDNIGSACAPSFKGGATSMINAEKAIAASNPLSPRDNIRRTSFIHGTGFGKECDKTFHYHKQTPAIPLDENGGRFTFEEPKPVMISQNLRYLKQPVPFFMDASNPFAFRPLPESATMSQGSSKQNDVVNKYQSLPIENSKIQIHTKLHRPSAAQPFPPISFGDILPPLPRVEPDGEPIIAGPNPYSLSASTSNPAANQGFTVTTTTTTTAAASNQSIVEGTSINLSINADFSGCALFHTLPETSNPQSKISVVSTDEYRMMRIQKQREMMTDGGSSLFVTSPRSFLLGCGSGGNTGTNVGW